MVILDSSFLNAEKLFIFLIYKGGGSGSTTCSMIVGSSGSFELFETGISSALSVDSSVARTENRFGETKNFFFIDLLSLALGEIDEADKFRLDGIFGEARQETWTSTNV